MRKITKRTAAVVAGGALAVATAGTAFAYWSTSGSGTGTAATQSGSVVLSYTTAALNSMYPGDSSQPLKVTVKNTSATQKGYVGGVKAYITTNQAGCTAADYLLNGTAGADATHPQSLTWSAVDLAAGASQDATGTIQFNNTGANQDACQGATVTLNYTSN